MNSNSFIWPSQPCILIPDTEKVYKPRPYRFYCQKTRNYFWLVNYTRSKILFLCSGNKLRTFKFERTLCIDTSATNFVYQKMELQSNIAYLWKKKLWCWSTFRFSSGKRHQNHDVAAFIFCFYFFIRFEYNQKGAVLTHCKVDVSVLTRNTSSVKKTFLTISKFQLVVNFIRKVKCTKYSHT